MDVNFMLYISKKYKVLTSIILLKNILVIFNQKCIKNVNIRNVKKKIIKNEISLHH